jgi:hypothetical protein
MTDTKYLVERRKHKRFEIRGGAYVAVGPNFDQVGPLIDISMGGLSFRYMASEKQPNGLSLDIFSADRDFYFGYVPFKEVSDLPTGEGPSSSPVMRRSSVRFEDLTHYQRAQLEHLIHEQNTEET